MGRGSGASQQLQTSATQQLRFVNQSPRTTTEPRQTAALPAHQLHIRPGSLVILAGPSGIGKSTWGRRVFGSAALISSDQIRAEIHGDENNQANPAHIFALVRERAAQRLANGQTTAIDATSLSARDRRPLVNLAHEHGYPVHLVILDGDRQLCLSGQQSRERQVPEAVIDRQLERLEQLKQRLHRGDLAGEGFASVQLLDRATSERTTLITD